MELDRADGLERHHRKGRTRRWLRQVRDVRQRLQFSRGGVWTENSADHCLAAAANRPMKSSFYAIVGDCHQFRLTCRPEQHRCRWSTGDPNSHRHSLTIVDYTDNAPGQSRVHELDIRRSAIPLRTYHFGYQTFGYSARRATRFPQENLSSTASMRQTASPPFRGAATAGRSSSQPV
jgi:hypothetical protein